MIKKYAEVKDNVIVNVSLWDTENPWQTDKEIIELADDSPMGIGWQKIEGVWEAAQPDPEFIAMQKAMLEQIIND